MAQSRPVPHPPPVLPSGEYGDVLRKAYAGTLNGQDFISWIQAAGPSAAQVQRVLNAAHSVRPNLDLGVFIQDGKIAFRIGGPADPGVNDPGILGKPPGDSSGGDGQSDWTNLMIRLAEFGIGAILLIIGFNAIVSKTKVYRQVEGVATGVAGKVVPGVAR